MWNLPKYCATRTSIRTAHGTPSGFPGFELSSSFMRARTRHVMEIDAAIIPVAKPWDIISSVVSIVKVLSGNSNIFSFGDISLSTIDKEFATAFAAFWEETRRLSRRPLSLLGNFDSHCGAWVLPSPSSDATVPQYLFSPSCTTLPTAPPSSPPPSKPFFSPDPILGSWRSNVSICCSSVSMRCAICRSRESKSLHDSCRLGLHASPLEEEGMRVDVPSAMFPQPMDPGFVITAFEMEMTMTESFFGFFFGVSSPTPPAPTEI